MMTQPQTPSAAINEEELPPFEVRNWHRFLQTVIVLMLPCVLVLGSVRLAMTETFVRWEYNRAGFPADNYGFTQDDRLEYGPYGIRYIVQAKDISYLGDLEINGEPAFNEDELHHMEDVQKVTFAVLQIMMITGSFFVMGAVMLLRRPKSRYLFFNALRYGAIFTVGAIVVVVAVVFLNWDFFFDNFHALFFEDGTWQFSTSDTLIRLYPQQFWFDASLFTGGVALLGAMLCIASPFLWQKFGTDKSVADEMIA